MTLSFNEENVRGVKSSADVKKSAELKVDYLIKVDNKDNVRDTVIIEVYSIYDERRILTIITKKVNRIPAIIEDLKKDYGKSKVRVINKFKYEKE